MARATLYSIIPIGDDESKKGGAGFTSQLWKARVSIMRANDVLLNVSDSYLFIIDIFEECGP